MIYRYYVGANNETGEVETEKLLAIIKEYTPGATLIPCKGIWNGHQEDSIILEIAEGIEFKSDELAEALRVGLNQQSVGLVVNYNVMNFI